MRNNLLKKLWESFLSVIPITILVVILALTLTDISGWLIGLFLVGAVLLVFGMGLFTLGADVAMMPMGNSVGAFLSRTEKKSRLPLVLLACFIIGFVITIAEPDLQVLANQLSSGSGTNSILIYTVAAGVGIFLTVSIARTFFNIKLKYLLLFFYGIVFAMAIALQFVNPGYLAVSFDSGGVTTGPITVPFLLALGVGFASVRGSKADNDDSFGMVALCSIGPIMAVMILGLTGAGDVGVTETVVPVINSVGDIMYQFGTGILHYMAEVALALLPIVAVFFLFQIFLIKLPKSQVIRILVGIVYTFVGLTIFLTGVNVGFMPLGKLLGAQLAGKSYNFVLIPLGMLMGCLIVLAEPAIHVLNKQVEEVTGGAISKKLMMICLCGGVAVSIGLAMIRVLTGISIWYFIVPAYAIALALTFFVPPIFTGIAFDSGGVASGPMTATFVLPFAMGACEIISGPGAILTDAFGIVAFVAMAPLVTIQLLGLVYKLKTKRLESKATSAVETAVEPVIFDDEDSYETIDNDDALIADVDISGRDDDMLKMPDLETINISTDKSSKEDNP